MMRILGGGKRFSFAGVLFGLSLLTGVLQADVTTTWTVGNGTLYAGSTPVGDLIGGFTYDSTSDSIISSTMAILDPPAVPLPVFLLGGDSSGLLAFADECCILGLTFLQPLTSAGGTVGIDPDASGLLVFDEGVLSFNGAYVTTPEPSIPAVIFVSAMGMVCLVYARRRHRGTRDT